MRRLLLALALLTLAAPVPADAKPKDGRGDATVVAIIDSGFTPYHYDFLASRMPQHRNSDRSDDLPLTTSPDKWLPGFPKTKAFDTFKPLKLSLPTDEGDSPAQLYTEDAETWAAVKPSGADLNYYWIPGSKVIGAMTFGSPTSTSRMHGGPGSHGTGTTSVSVGNQFGTCPECLLVFLQYTDEASGEAAIDWALKQPWIDVVSNSYGFHTAGTGNTRDNIYSGANTQLQRSASDRGQTVFWSAGNGYENGFVIPNQTLLSSQKGPDWIITVTAVDPTGGTYTGAGKPADVAGIGYDYPSAYGATSAGGKGANGFSGTSNATPTVAGAFSKALYLARRAMPGASRAQSRGVIAQGSYACGGKRKDCELRGGLTATELRFRLLQSAVTTGKGYTEGQTGLGPFGTQPADSRYAVEGHGTYFAKFNGEAAWQKEFARFWDVLTGDAAPPARPAGERDWFLVDSWCRQHIWGEWTGGYWRQGTQLPEADPAYPTRASYQRACENMRPVA